MQDISKLPVYFSLIFSLLILIINIYNGNSFKLISIYVSISIVAFYMLGAFTRYLINRAIASYIEKRITQPKTKNIRKQNEDNKQA